MNLGQIDVFDIVGVVCVLDLGEIKSRGENGDLIMGSKSEIEGENESEGESEGED